MRNVKRLLARLATRLTIVFLPLISTPSLAQEPIPTTNAFRFRLPSDPSTLDWLRASTFFETHVIMNIMEGLVEIDSSLNPVPALAESWEVSKDGLVYTFKLKPGIKWSDGVPLTARDFIFAWRRLLNPASKIEYASYLYDIERAEDYHRGKLRDFSKVGMRALDKERIEVRLRKIVPFFPTLLSFWVTFPQREDQVAQKGWDSPAKLVVLGPYSVSNWEKGKQIVFERNSSYHGKPPSVSRVEALIEPDADRARKLLRENKIDALLDVNTEDILEFASDATKTLRQFDYLATVFLAFNTTAKPVHKSALRRAIAQGIDRRQLPGILKGGQVPADSLITKGIQGYEPQALPFSSEQARVSLLTSGYRSAAEVPSLSLLAIRGRHKAISEHIRKELRSSLDLNIELKMVSPAEYSRLRKSGKFQIVIAQWGADYPDAASFMELLLSDNPANYTRWSNPRYDRLVKSAGGSLKVLERLRAYSDAQKILLQDDSVVVPLYYPKLTALVSSRVQKFEINPLNYLFFKQITLK